MEFFSKWLTDLSKCVRTVCWNMYVRCPRRLRATGPSPVKLCWFWLFTPASDAVCFTGVCFDVKKEKKEKKKGKVHNTHHGIKCLLWGAFFHRRVPALVLCTACHYWMSETANVLHTCSIRVNFLLDCTVSQEYSQNKNKKCLLYQCETL